MIVIVVVSIALLAVVSSIMIEDLRRKSGVAADEIVELLSEPLFNLDESQVSRIGEALIDSGRISGIRVVSDVSAAFFDKPSPVASPSIPSLERVVRYRDIEVGVVRMDFSDADVVATRNRLTTAMALIVVAVAIANLIANRILIRGKIERPISAMIGGIDAVAEGRYDVSIPETGFSDVDAIIALINAMAGKVRAKNAELTAMNDSLERQVGERTSELERSLEELGTAQDRLLESSKLAALGHLSAGIAHELNTPLGAIVSSIDGLVEYLDDGLENRLERDRALGQEQAALYRKVVSLSAPGCANLETALAGSRRAPELLARARDAGLSDGEEIADHLAELGLADEYAALEEALRIPDAARALAEAFRDIEARRMAEVTRVSASMAVNVVAALRSYLSPESKEADRIVDIVPEIDKVLVLMHNALKRGIRVTREFAGARVRGSPERLSQVWMNLIRNAAQAMDYSGDLVIRVGTYGEEARISVIDSGPGIPGDLQDRIFEPFFSTKKDGEGMGLGLMLCKRIVEAHGGRIDVDSRPGSTRFTVVLPAATIVG